MKVDAARWESMQFLALGSTQVEAGKSRRDWGHPRGTWRRRAREGRSGDVGGSPQSRPELAARAGVQDPEGRGRSEARAGGRRSTASRGRGASAWGCRGDRREGEGRLPGRAGRQRSVPVETPLSLRRRPCRPWELEAAVGGSRGDGGKSLWRPPPPNRIPPPRPALLPYLPLLNFFPGINKPAARGGHLRRSRPRADPTPPPRARLGSGFRVTTPAPAPAREGACARRRRLPGRCSLLQRRALPGGFRFAAVLGEPLPPPPGTGLPAGQALQPAPLWLGARRRLA
ncbi:uncharacterized protein [Symphalangus syndactylus]|uniref:uncharacterized protein n=1 Tax=Symphalangus syndactylus TaxID=9590 RepID=UPI00300794CB